MGEHIWILGGGGAASLNRDVLDVRAWWLCRIRVSSLHLGENCSLFPSQTASQLQMKPCQDPADTSFSMFPFQIWKPDSSNDTAVSACYTEPDVDLEEPGLFFFFLFWGQALQTKTPAPTRVPPSLLRPSIPATGNTGSFKTQQSEWISIRFLLPVKQPPEEEAAPVSLFERISIVDARETAFLNSPHLVARRCRDIFQKKKRQQMRHRMSFKR